MHIRIGFVSVPFLILLGYINFQADANGAKTEATVDDVIKIVEDLTRIH